MATIITLILLMRKWAVERSAILLMPIFLLSRSHIQTIWLCCPWFLITVSHKRDCISENCQGIVWLRILGKIQFGSNSLKYFTIIKIKRSRWNINNEWCFTQLSLVILNIVYPVSILHICCLGALFLSVLMEMDPIWFFANNVQTKILFFPA